MKMLIALLVLGLASCSSSGPKTAHYPDAQRIVEQVTSKHADVVRLTVHAVPTGESRSRVIASNVAEKLDDWSDPEDTQAMTTKQPVTLHEGPNLDYTLPVIDPAGKAIAAVGVTVKGSNHDAMLSSAKKIAGELSAAILAAGKPLW